MENTSPKDSLQVGFTISVGSCIWKLFFQLVTVKDSCVSHIPKYFLCMILIMILQNAIRRESSHEQFPPLRLCLLLLNYIFQKEFQEIEDQVEGAIEDTTEYVTKLRDMWNSRDNKSVCLFISLPRSPLKEWRSFPVFILMQLNAGLQSEGTTYIRWSFSHYLVQMMVRHYNIKLAFLFILHVSHIKKPNVRGNLLLIQQNLKKRNTFGGYLWWKVTRIKYL